MERNKGKSKTQTLKIPHYLQPQEKKPGANHKAPTVGGQLWFGPPKGDQDDGSAQRNLTYHKGKHL